MDATAWSAEGRYDGPESAAPMSVFTAWHYTTGEHFLQILKRRTLVPRQCSESPLARPILWFSVHPQFEPTACLVDRRPDGALHHLTVSETAERGGGLARLGISVCKLMTCSQLRRKARLSEEDWEAMRELALERGGDPDQWFGSVAPIPLKDLIVEVLDEQGRWMRMQASALAGSSDRRRPLARAGA